MRQSSFYKNTLVVLLSVLWFASGCVYSQKEDEIVPAIKLAANYFNTATSVILYSENLKPFVFMWYTEVTRKYPNSIIVLSHGVDLEGDWWCEYPDDDDKRLVSEVVDQIRVQYPVRRIVLIICNPGGYILDTPNISYSLVNIWVMPDRELDVRSWFDPDTLGNIYEMQEN